MTIVVNFKRLVDSAQRPRKAHQTDAGFDLVATSAVKLEDGLYEYGSGLAIELPKGHCGLLFPRSSISKTGAQLCNSIGLIDENFRGEIKARFYADRAPYLIGDRIAQLVVLPLPYVVFQEVEELEKTDRGAGGFGSSGN